MDVALHISCGMMGQGLPTSQQWQHNKKRSQRQNIEAAGALLHIRYPPVVGEAWPPWRRAERLRMERWLPHSHDSTTPQ